MASKIPKSFGDYIGKKSKLDLISDWTEGDLSLARKMLKRLTELVVGQSVERGRSNQASGNKFEKLVIRTLANPGVLDLRILKTKGQGYPDLVLDSRKHGAILCMEIKSTSNWDDKDSNRRVLMSSVKRLENLRKGNPGKRFLHFICSIEYDAKAHTAMQLRFHFINRSSPVNYREEISTSQKSLSSGGFETYSP